MSLTGDPITDQLAPIALRFVVAVHDFDREAIDELLAETILVTKGKCDPAIALAVVCACIVPADVLDRPMSQIYGPARIRAEYDRLRTAGIAERIARELSGMTFRKETAA